MSVYYLLHHIWLYFDATGIVNIWSNAFWNLIENQVMFFALHIIWFYIEKNYFTKFLVLQAVSGKWNFLHKNFAVYIYVTTMKNSICKLIFNWISDILLFASVRTTIYQNDLTDYVRLLYRCQCFYGVFLMGLHFLVT